MVSQGHAQGLHGRGDGRRERARRSRPAILRELRVRGRVRVGAWWVRIAMRGLLGVIVLLFLAWALGERRRGDRERRIPWRTVITGLGLQAALAVLLMRFPPASHLLLLLNRATLA